MDEIEFRDGKFTVVGTDKAIAMTDVAKAFYAPAGPALGSASACELPGSTGVPGGPPE